MGLDGAMVVYVMGCVGGLRPLVVGLWWLRAVRVSGLTCLCRGSQDRGLRPVVVLVG